MSGHSHWSSIKHAKGAADKKRGKLFSKLSKIISVAARKGPDPDLNPTLRMAIEKAKKANMPNDSIEKAIKRGTGELEGENLEEFVFEAYGPAKSAVIITGITSNRNRALNEVKTILNQHNAKMAEEGSVRWQFENKGIIVIEPKQESKENAELKAIDAGAQDLSWQGNILEVYTTPNNLDEVKKKLETSFEIESATLGWVPKDEIEIKETESIKKLFEALGENDDVQEVYSNIKL